ncbi:MAG: hypothetical protein E4G98_05940 [Promethearchaeota archaeon]|nr:MAG: hypothetical protein E4G98_05940 [Candidatus Lokiarchaeota archaeon]
MMEEKIEEKKQISYGKLISREDFMSDRCMPADVKNKLEDVPHYLFIFIPSDEILKISVFPSKNPTIKKILIRLKEFSPELVKGISDILKNFKLGSSTIHTTGLCFENINCFYETYMSVVDMPTSMDEIKAEFMKVPRVEEVSIIDIPIEKW